MIRGTLYITIIISFLTLLRLEITRANISKFEISNHADIESRISRNEKLPLSILTEPDLDFIPELTPFTKKIITQYSKQLLSGYPIEHLSGIGPKRSKQIAKHIILDR